MADGAVLPRLGSHKMCVLLCIGLFSFLFMSATILQFALFTSGKTKLRGKSRFPGDQVEDQIYRALLADMGLILLFVGQHSLMKASDGWKMCLQWLDLDVANRAVYSICTSTALQCVMRYWRPVDAVVWELLVPASDEKTALFFTSLHSLCWVVLLGGALIMDFAELVGLKQIYYGCMSVSEPISHKSKETRSVFGEMRHAGLLAFLVILWVHPVMTLSRFIFSIAFTWYLLARQAVNPPDYLYLKSMFCKKATAIQVLLSEADCSLAAADEE